MRDYPHNYDWLPEEKQNALVDWFNIVQKQADAHLKKSFTLQVKDLARVEREDYNKLSKQLIGAAKALEKIGLYMEYNWIGHRNEWFLATSVDWEMQEDWQIQCID